MHDPQSSGSQPSDTRLLRLRPTGVDAAGGSAPAGSQGRSGAFSAETIRGGAATGAKLLSYELRELVGSGGRRPLVYAGSAAAIVMLWVTCSVPNTNVPSTSPQAPQATRWKILDKTDWPREPRPSEATKAPPAPARQTLTAATSTTPTTEKPTPQPALTPRPIPIKQPGVTKSNAATAGGAKQTGSKSGPAPPEGWIPLPPGGSPGAVEYRSMKYYGTPPPGFDPSRPPPELEPMMMPPEWMGGPMPFVPGPDGAPLTRGGGRR